ncbi:hypothetical protein HTG_03635 [Natrinema mahii]|nr:hypothetical protein HTG_03635 [Natrinema mahii]
MTADPTELADRDAGLSLESESDDGRNESVTARWRARSGARSLRATVVSAAVSGLVPACEGSVVGVGTDARGPETAFPVRRRRNGPGGPLRSLS